MSELGQVHRLLHKRFQRLSPEAQQVLAYVVTAGGRVSTQQLGDLTGLGDNVDVAVSELARQRLVADEATGGECISIFHDHVADELSKELGDEVKRKAHHAWASWLVRRDNTHELAPRIAGHLFAAGEPGRAVAHAILAAEDAERRVAITEAARWYARVIDHVDGQEKIDQLRNASRCYQEADFPVEAAELYQRLAQLVDEEERIECQLLATTLLIRSGRCSLVRQQLHDLATVLDLPKPKAAWQSQLSLIWNGLRLAGGGRKALVSRLTDDHTDIPDASSESGTPPKDSQLRQRRQQQRLRLCLSLVRPMSMFDGLYAAELSTAASLLALRHGNPDQTVHAIVSDAVFACYDIGFRRIEGEIALLELRPHVDRLNSPWAEADLWAGIAYSHALASRWAQVPQPVQMSVQHYETVTKSHSFELAHIRWIDLWARWHLGRWDTMQQIGWSAFVDAVQRNDLFQQVITISGFSGAVWLARDEPAELRQLRAGNTAFDCPPEPIQILRVFDWITSIQTHLYQGEFAEAWDVYQSMLPSLNKRPYSKIQMIRVSRQLLGAVIALHQYAKEGSEHWIARTEP